MHGLIFETSVCYWQNQPGYYSPIVLGLHRINEVDREIDLPWMITHSNNYQALTQQYRLDLMANSWPFNSEDKMGPRLCQPPIIPNTVAYHIACSWRARQYHTHLSITNYMPVIQQTQRWEMTRRENRIWHEGIMSGQHSHCQINLSRTAVTTQWFFVLSFHPDCSGDRSTNHPTRRMLSLSRKASDFVSVQTSARFLVTNT
jgi:hypothetical protein